MALKRWQKLSRLVSEAKEAGEASLYYCSACEPLGFKSMFMGEIPPGNKLMQNQMLHALPGDPWPLHYSNSRFRFVDPSIELARSLQYDAITWSQAKQHARKNSHATAMYEDATKFGLYDGVAFLRYTQNYTIGYLTIAGGINCLRKLPELDYLRLQNMAREVIVKEASFSLVSEISKPPPEMTTRMKEILHMVMEGYTNKHIMEHFGVSEGAVEYHLCRLYDAFQIPDNARLNKRMVLANKARKYDLSPIEPVMTKVPNYENIGDVPN